MLQQTRHLSFDNINKNVMAWIHSLQAISLKKIFVAVQQKANDSLADTMERENMLFPDVEIYFWREAPAHN